MVMGIMEWLRKRWWGRQEKDAVGDSHSVTIMREAVEARQAKAEADENFTRAEALREDSERTHKRLHEKEFSEWLLGPSPRLRRRES